jgi:DMSO reductase family type II enzyme heme b subunit
MTRPIYLLLFVSAIAGCQRPAVVTPEVIALRIAALPERPDDPAWNAAPEHIAKLLLQDLVEPRLMTPSTPEVRVRALANASHIAFRLEWVDAEANDLPGAGRFPDGCAVQLPQKNEVTVPDPQMGMTGRGVHITYWRADWQASVNGRGDSITELYPHATVDHYPFTSPSLEHGSDAQSQMARRYAPADAVDNRRGGPRTTAVEDLVAEGPGTISRAPSLISRGLGDRTAQGWAVVIVRPIPDGLTPAARTQVAFAVWEGSAQEAGARKMRSGWVGLALRETS